MLTHEKLRIPLGWCLSSTHVKIPNNTQKQLTERLRRFTECIYFFKRSPHSPRFSLPAYDACAASSVRLGRLYCSASCHGPFPLCTMLAGCRLRNSSYHICNVSWCCANRLITYDAANIKISGHLTEGTVHTEGFSPFDRIKMFVTRYVVRRTVVYYQYCCIGSILL